jgi:hypothetical protein
MWYKAKLCGQIIVGGGWVLVAMSTAMLSAAQNRSIAKVLLNREIPLAYNCLSFYLSTSSVGEPFSIHAHIINKASRTNCSMDPFLPHSAEPSKNAGIHTNFRIKPLNILYPTTGSIYNIAGRRLHYHALLQIPQSTEVAIIQQSPGPRKKMASFPTRHGETWLLR